MSAKGKLKLAGLSKGGGEVSEINVTPLIDVVLVLLIIFMVITPILLHKMAVNLPEKTETVPQDDLPQDQLVVAACKDGSYSLNRTIYTLEQLNIEVRRRLKPKAEKVVFVDADPDVAYDNVVLLMDSIRDAGAARIGVASLKVEPDEFLACTPLAAAPPVDPAAPVAPATP